jgi:hypothetical protein
MTKRSELAKTAWISFISDLMALGRSARNHLE